MTDLYKYLCEFRKLKKEWFKANRTNDIDLRRLIEKQMRLINSKIDIEFDSASSKDYKKYHEPVKLETQHYLQSFDYLASLEDKV